MAGSLCFFPPHLQDTPGHDVWSKCVATPTSLAYTVSYQASQELPSSIHPFKSAKMRWVSLALSLLWSTSALASGYRSLKHAGKHIFDHAQKSRQNIPRDEPRVFERTSNNTGPKYLTSKTKSVLSILRLIYVNICNGRCFSVKSTEG